MILGWDDETTWTIRRIQWMTACSARPLSQHSHAPTFSSRIASLCSSTSALAIRSLILSLSSELDITSLALVFILFYLFSAHLLCLHRLARVYIVGSSNGISSLIPHVGPPLLVAVIEGSVRVE